MLEWSAPQNPGVRARSALATARAAGRAVAFGVWTQSVVSGLRAARRVDPKLHAWDRTQRFVRAWSRGTVRLFGIELSVQGSPPADRGPYLVVANHRSPLDILVTLHLVGGVVLSNHGVASMPIVGEGARLNDTIFVDREDRASGALAVRQMRRRLSEGRNVIAFPEGTTFAGDEVRPFGPGAFAAARGLDGVRVLPMGLAYEPGCEWTDETFGQHLLRMSSAKRTRIWVSFGAPRPVPERGDEGDVRREVQALVDRAAGERDRRA